MKKLISADPLTGISTYFVDDPSSSKFHIETVQDIEPVLEMNRVRMTDGSNGWTPSKDMKHVASVPMIVLQIWANEAGVAMNDPAFGEVVKRKLNDADFSKMRTSEGDI